MGLRCRERGYAKDRSGNIVGLVDLPGEDIRPKTKVCNSCKEELPLDTEHFYYKNKRSGWNNFYYPGWDWACKKCHIKNVKKYYLKNKDKIKEYDKKRYLKNREKRMEQMREYYIKNREKLREQQGEYYLKKKQEKANLLNTQAAHKDRTQDTQNPQ